jgi:hypothetical protein
MHFSVLVSVHCSVVSLQVLESSLYRGGAVRFFTDSTIFLHRYLSDSTFTTVSLPHPRSQVYLVFVHCSYIMQSYLLQSFNSYYIVIS